MNDVKAGDGEEKMPGQSTYDSFALALQHAYEQARLVALAYFYKQVPETRRGTA